MAQRNSEKTIQVSTTLTLADYEAIKKLSAKTGKPISAIMRQHILDGMSIEKSKDDIDFIRKQILEELEIAFEARMNRIIKLLIKIGTLTYPMAHFNAMVIAATAKKQGINYRKLLEDAQKEGAYKLNIQSDAVDLMFDRINEFGE